MRRKIFSSVIVLLVWAGSSVQAGDLGIVATNCKAEIEKFCADKQHGQGDVRACLVAKKDELSEVCKKALDSTGPRKGKGMGQKQGK